MPLLVAHETCAGSTRELGIDADPSSLKLSLDHFESFQGSYVTVAPRDLL